MIGKKIFLGIDFSEGQIQLSAIRGHWGRLTSLGHWQLEDTLGKTQEALASICQELTEKEAPVAVVGLSRRQVIYREFTLPPLKKSAIPQAVGYQLVEKSPFEPDQIKFAYRLKEIPAGWQVEALAVPIRELDSLSSLLSEAGFSQILFAPSSQAMAQLAGKGDFVVGRVGKELELGLADSWWGRDLPLPAHSTQEYLDEELKRTLAFLEGQTGRKLKLRLAGHSEHGWQPIWQGQSLNSCQLVAVGLALLGARGQTLELKAVGAREESWFQNPYLLVPICLWLAVAATACYLGLSLRTTRQQLAQVETQLPAEKVQSPVRWDEMRQELSRLRPNSPPQVPLLVLRQLALAPEPGEGYLSLTISQGEVKELSTIGPEATDFIKRIATGPLSALSLEGPIVKEEGQEKFTLAGPVEAHHED